MKGRGLKPGQTRAPNGGSAMHVLRTRGGYRINLDGSISSQEEVLEERRQEALSHMENKKESA